MEIRRLADGDVPAAMDLSRQAGWNQVSADWRRLLDLAPETCFGGWVDGELVATATLVAYAGEAGWIGMVLVDEDHRRNGYGSEIVDRALDAADGRVAAVGLDATDAGRPLYRDAGFVDVAPVERWYGELSADGAALSDAAAADVDVAPIASGDRDALVALDRRACGVDRSELLDHLLDEDDAVAVAVGDDLRGYAVGRPGRRYDQIGPVIAPSEADAGALVCAAAEALGSDDVLVDVPAPDDGVRGLLERLGLRPQRSLARMTLRASDALLVGDDVIAAAGLELG